MALQKQKEILTLLQFSPYSIARMLWKRRMLTLAVWLGIAAVAAAIIYSLPDVYRAEAVILVDSQKIPEKYVASTVQLSLQDSLSSIGQRVLNVGKLHSIVKDFHLYESRWKTTSPEELVEVMRGDLNVTLERGISGNRSGAFRISYDGRNPSVVAGVVRRITDLFIEENLSSREQRAEGTADFIETQLQAARKRLNEQESALSAYKVANAGRLPQQEGALIGALGRLQAELQGNQDAINRAQQSKILLESTLKFSESALNTATRALRADSSPAQVRTVTNGVESSQPAVKASETLRSRLAALRMRYLDDHPEVKRLQADLDRVLADEARNPAPPPKPADPNSTAPVLTAEVRPPDPAALAEVNRERERVASTRAQLEVIGREIEARNTKRDEIVRSIGEYQGRVEALPIREQQMSSLTRDYETSKMAYQQLLDKKLSATMATDMERSNNSERFTVADPAREPSKPVKPKRALLLGVATFFGLAAGLALGLALELKKNQFLGEWELPPSVRVLGRIPTMHPESNRLAGGIQ